MIKLFTVAGVAFGITIIWIFLIIQNKFHSFSFLVTGVFQSVNHLAVIKITVIVTFWHFYCLNAVCQMVCCIVDLTASPHLNSLELYPILFLTMIQSASVFYLSLLYSDRRKFPERRPAMEAVNTPIVQIQNLDELRQFCFLSDVSNTIDIFFLPLK